jgi:hypothetical protein
MKGDEEGWIGKIKSKFRDEIAYFIDFTY